MNNTQKLITEMLNEALNPEGKKFLVDLTKILKSSGTSESTKLKIFDPIEDKDIKVTPFDAQVFFKVFNKLSPKAQEGALKHSMKQNMKIMGKAVDVKVGSR